MQLRIRNNEDSTSNGNISKFMKISSALFVASSILLAFPSTNEAFVPSSFSQRKAPSSLQLYYTMPDVTNMRATDMKQELESYGINTQTLFDKREYEQALIEARRNYEQTLNDVLSSNRPKEKKKTQPRRKTVNYDRSRHSDERIYSSDVNDQPGRGFTDDHYQQQQQRRRRHYQAEPNPVGNFGNFEKEYGGKNGPQNVGVGGRSSRRRRPAGGPGKDWFEEDPLFSHERQTQNYRTNDGFYQNDPYEQFDEYEVGGRHKARATYDDPAKEMKYQAALQESYQMKVEDIQQELNSRGISTIKCMIFKDFCIEYAKAIAEDVEKSEESAFEDDDEDYDPSYRDVVMQKFDPSMWT